ncbi:MAG: glycosyltransferase N-terminal domain-containing protein [Elusimicrobiota bacterium]|nr:glycosyltransferase N-terminal domain-containing protein [Elusimicrobiota bacterium]
MGPALIIINTVTLLFLPTVILLVSLPRLYRYIKRSRGTFYQRFFLPSGDFTPGGVWFQASSVGEVKLALALAGEFKDPSRPLYLFAQTPEGRALGKSSGVFTGVYYAPLDIFFITDSFIKKVAPACVVLVELQLWPNLIESAGCFSKIVLVNGRVSDRSFPKYKLIKPLTRMMLKKIDVISARTKKDAERFIAMGAEPARVSVAGNIKYDIGFSGKNFPVSREDYAVPRQALLITAGSTHRGEEEAVMDAVLSLKGEVYCAIVPRHIERVREIERVFRRRGITCSRYVRDGGFTPSSRFLLVDGIGVLGGLYGISDICFVGGSLVPHGGQNFVEAVQMKKPVVVGTHMGNFREEFDILKNELLVVPDKVSLAGAFESLACSKEMRDKKALAAFSKLDMLKGAIRRNKAFIQDSLGNT